MLYKCYTNVSQVLYNATKTGVSCQCHSVKRLSRLPCAVCTLERRCQLISKGDHGGRHASREVMRTHGGMASLAFREAARARLAWRDRHPCVRTAFHGVITSALTLFRYIHFNFTAPLADGLGQGICARTATGSPHWNTHWQWGGHWDGHLHWQLCLTPFAAAHPFQRQ